jgi:MFS family permease
MNKSNLAWYRLAALTSFAFAIGMALNVVEPAVLVHKIIELSPDRRNTILGLATAAGLAVAVLVQPIIGSLSDRTRTPLGRRIPYFFLGAVIVSAALFIMAVAPTLIALVAAILLFQFGSNTVQGPWQALIPDQVPKSQHGRAAGFKATLEIASFVVGRQLSGRLVADERTLEAVAITIVVYVIALIITFRVANRAEPSSETLSISAALRNSFYIDWKREPRFVWWFINRLLFIAGFIALNTFLLNYLIEVMQMTEPDAQVFFANMIGLLGVFILLIAIPAGRLADRIGPRPLLNFSGVLAIGGTLIVVLIPGQITLLLAGAIVGISAGVFFTANWALVTDIVPASEAARYLGLANIATASGSFLSRSLGGLIIDPINLLTGDQAAGYILLYSLTIVGFLGGLAALRRMP